MDQPSVLQHGSGFMPARTRCPLCETVLNVPPGAGGKSLKCPRCGTKFRPSEVAPGAGSGFGSATTETATPASSPSSPATPKPPRSPQARDDDDLPFVTGDLRDQFDLPLLHETDDDSASKPKSKSKPKRKAPQQPGQPKAPKPPRPSKYDEAEAAGLLDDDEPVHATRRYAAEARAQTRRCPCGGVVPQGMTVCPRCGLDLESGERTDPFDLLEPEALPEPPQAMPYGVMFVGAGSAAVGVMLGLTAIFLFFARSEAPHRWGFLLLAAVCAFAVHAALRLLNGRSAQPLAVALALGAAVDIVALIILPILFPSDTIEPPKDPIAAENAAVEPGAQADSGLDAPRFGDGSGTGAADRASPHGSSGAIEVTHVPHIRPLTERIEWGKVHAGLAILVVIILCALYLASGEVQRYTSRGSRVGMY